MENWQIEEPQPEQPQPSKWCDGCDNPERDCTCPVRCDGCKTLVAPGADCKCSGRCEYDEEAGF